MATPTEQSQRDEQAQAQGHLGEFEFPPQFDMGNIPIPTNAPADLGYWNQVGQAYFDLADATLRTSRRVAEVAAIHGMRQQIVNDVAAVVYSRLLRDIQRQNQSQIKH